MNGRIYIALVAAFMSAIIVVQGCTFNVSEPYAIEQVSFVNGQYSMKINAISEEKNAPLANSTLYLNFRKNIASYSPFQDDTAPIWANQTFDDSWYNSNDIAFTQSSNGSEVILQVYNATNFLFNISFSISDSTSMSNFVAFYYPIDMHFYVVFSNGSALATDITTNQTSFLPLPPGWDISGRISTKSIPAKNGGLFFEFAGCCYCENGRYFKPTPDGFKLMGIDNYFNSIIISERWHTLFIFEIYFSTGFSVQEKDIFTLQSDKWIANLPTVSQQGNSTEQDNPTIGYLEISQLFPIFLVAVTVIRLKLRNLKKMQGNNPIDLFD